MIMKMIRIARNKDALGVILDAARYSCTGQMIYRKWSQSERKYVFHRYEVIPIDCGVTSRGNFVMYAQDYNNGNQIKMFIVKQIIRFKKTNRRVKPSFPIQLKRLETGFGIGPGALEPEDENGQE